MRWASVIWIARNRWKSGFLRLSGEEIFFTNHYLSYQFTEILSKFLAKFAVFMCNSLHYDIITRHLEAIVTGMAEFPIRKKKTFDWPQESDRRSQIRIPASNYAYLHAETGAVLSQCLVKDISVIGAGIILQKAASLPKQIMLRVTGEETPMRASVVWRAGTKCGLEFNGTAVSVAPTKRFWRARELRPALRNVCRNIHLKRYQKT